MLHQSEKLDNIQAYKEITQEYLNYLSPEEKTAKSAKISSWRYTFTNSFYTGPHARFFLWDMLAGVGNDSLFAGKSEHADFIVLMNRIALFDKGSEFIFKAIMEVNDKEQLCNLFLDYFMTIEKNTPDKNEEYYRCMRGLKRDINHFVQSAGIKKRIKRRMSCQCISIEHEPGPYILYGNKISSLAAYIYIQSSNEFLFVDKTKNKLVRLSLNEPQKQKLKKIFSQNEHGLSVETVQEIASITGYAPHYLYEVADLDKETEINKAINRSFNAIWGECAKSMATFMGMTESAIAVAGFKAGIIKMLAGVTSIVVGVSLSIIQCVSFLGGLFFGYMFAEDEFRKLGKQLFLGRLLQVKNPNTGEYEDLKNYQKILTIIVAPPCSLIAGICIGSLAFFSVKDIILPFVHVGIPIVFSSACFVAVTCLVTASFFLTLKEVISHVTKEKIDDYFASLKKESAEKSLDYSLRLAWEAFKWVVALGVMTMVAIGGYYVFKDKCKIMLDYFFPAISDTENKAKFFSKAFSATKFVFTVNKIRDILQLMVDGIKNKFSSKKEETNEGFNRFQKESIGWLSSSAKVAALGVRAASTAGFYWDAVTVHHAPYPVTPRVSFFTTFWYSSAFYGMPAFKKQKQETIDPVVETRQKPAKR